MTEAALRLLHSVNHLWTLFFVAFFPFLLATGDSRMLSAESVPSFNFITAGLTARQAAMGGRGANSILRPCMVAISWRHLSCHHPSSTPALLLFFPSSSLCLFYHCLCLPLPPSLSCLQMQLSSTDNSLTKRSEGLASAPRSRPDFPPPSMPRLSQGYREEGCPVVSERFSLAPNRRTAVL